MKIRILLFARYVECAGGGEVAVELPEGATVGDAWRRLGELHPRLATGGETPLAAVDRSYARMDAAIDAAAEIAFFPPVSGG